ncbi:autophagy-related protein 13-domain-containing protein [Truncatella angustata]|uniref:Autophagy-related protein 13 n=1 Tax=Truncatella angustata TaxID=152316 RepID=A0A9P8RKF5_9PEZI|nr:autophagy-related protein 13-domain-containing protein [Truncatella angustata]KAH6647519.1 autophagy-related protein 13-domain-containing protein [Truncatella angustata]
MRTNNPRETTRPGGHSRAGSEATAQESSVPIRAREEGADAGPSRDSVKKLDQIIQNIFAKTGTLILQERMKVTPVLVAGTREKKISKWFQLDTDEIEDFRDEFRTWKHCGGFENRPPPIIIETYLDTSRLKSGQSLIILDENGKRWDVVEAMNSSDLSSDSSSSGGRSSKKPNTHLVLERWRVELKGSSPNDPEEFGPLLPTVYKKAIIFIRSIYTTTGILPTWKLARNSKTKGSHPALQIKCRVLSAESRPSGFDALRSPLYEGRGDVSTDYMFGLLEVPVGRFYASVSYRNNCNFQVVETESLLSSRIGLAISDDLFKPSLPHRGDSRRDTAVEIGSLPYHRHEIDITENQQRYGSLSTFHGAGPHGTSPISALRAIKSPGSDTTSPPQSQPASVDAPPHSLPIAAPARPPIRPDGRDRRPSVSFQPFKQGSLSQSPVPRMQDFERPASPHSLTRGPGLNQLTHVRNRSSLTAGMPASLRGGPPPAAADSPLVGSPKPGSTNRFSSSFTHRRSRASFGGASRAGDDDQTSSGKQSLASSLAQPGSGLLNEAGAGGSSSSFQTDDDNIQEFLKALESKKTLQSFEPSKRGEATRKTNAQLSKFHLMRESNNALTDSLNSSMQLHRSSSSSSRQLANVPGMSVSSSPGKPLSPHTPHTPAVPSRLSENSSVDYAAPARSAARARTGRSVEAPTSVPPTLEGTTAIDIPLSPRPYQHVRRSSSAAQPRVLADDDDAHRSLSLGADDREPPSLSALLGRHEALEDADEAADSPILQAPADIRSDESAEMLRQASSSAERETRPPGGLYGGLSSSPYKRYGVGSGRGSSTPQSGNSSLTGPSTRYGRSYPRGGAAGLGVTGGPSEEPEEELLFDMSELGHALNRRSIEEGRGGGSVGSAPDRGGYDSSRGASRRW